MISDILIMRINKHYEEHDKRPDKLGLTQEQFKALISEYPYGASLLREAPETKSSEFMGVPIEIVEVEKELAR